MLPLVEIEIDILDKLERLYLLSSSHPEMFTSDNYSKKKSDYVEYIEHEILQLLAEFNRIHSRDRNFFKDLFSRSPVKSKGEIFSLLDELKKFYDKNPHKILNNSFKFLIDFYSQVNAELFDSFVLKVVKRPDEVLDIGFRKKVNTKKKVNGEDTFIVSEKATSLSQHIKGEYEGSVFISVTNPYLFHKYDFVRAHAKNYVETLEKKGNAASILKINLKKAWPYIKQIYLSEDIYYITVPDRAFRIFQKHLPSLKPFKHRYSAKTKMFSNRNKILNSALSSGEIIIELKPRKMLVDGVKQLVIYLPPDCFEVYNY